MKVVLTHLATTDLEEIGDQIALGNPARAVTFVTELRIKALSLGDFPQIGASRPEWGAGVRFVSHGAYLIVYRVHEKAVEILRVIHGMRNLDALFKNE